MANQDIYRFLSCPDRSSVIAACTLEIEKLVAELAHDVGVSSGYKPLHAHEYGVVFLETIESMVGVGRTMTHIATEIVAKDIYRVVFNKGEIVYGRSYYQAIEMASKWVVALIELSKAAEIKLALLFKARDVALDNIPRLSA